MSETTDILIIVTLIGSWVVPIATLLISQKMGKKSLKNMFKKADVIGNDVKIAQKEIDARILDSQEIDDIIKKYQISKDDIKKMIDEVQKEQFELFKTEALSAIDGKIGNIQRQITLGIRKTMKEIVKEMKENGETESPLGMLSMFIK